SDASRQDLPAAVAGGNSLAPPLPPVPADPASVRQDPRLAHLPERGMTEQSSYGPLPVRAADGRRPFDVYSRGWSGARGARIAIVIGNFGLSPTDSINAIQRLPGAGSLAFAPLGNSFARWMTIARNQGHELVLQLSFESSDYPRVDPGRGTLTIAA